MRASLGPAAPGVAGDPADRDRTRPPERARRLLNRVGPSFALGTLAFLLSSPPLAVLHELLLLGMARLLNRVGSFGAALATDGTIPLNPVYTGTFFVLLGNIRVQGVALPGPLGQLLHELRPGLFAPPELLAAGAVASAVVLPGASVLARGLVDLVGDAAILTLGLALCWLGSRPAGHLRSLQLTARPHWLLVWGALLQAEVVVRYLVDETLTLRDLEATGLTYGFSVLFTGPAAERPRLSTLFAELPAPLSGVVLGGAVIALAYGLALVLGLGPWLVWRRSGLARRLASQRRRSRPGLAFGRWWLPRASGLAAFALIVTVSPLGALAEATSNDLPPAPVQPSGALPAPAAAGPSHERLLAQPAAPTLGAEQARGNPPPASTQQPEAAPPPQAAPPTLAALPTAAAIPFVPQPAEQLAEQPAEQHGPALVEVSGSGYAYTYTVNGRPEVIRGMGYNPMYVGLPPAERAAHYDRDFAAMRQAGVNTLLGWVTEEFDLLLLDRAEANGLGVILPYHLDPELDYVDPNVQLAVARDVMAWVERYRNHPALRMWGLGNEVLHKLVYPSWMQVRGDPVLETRAQVFALYYVALIDLIRQADPRHPVIYRDAEDSHLSRLRDALNAGRTRRPWFVYGVNIYTPRLAEVIEGWTEHKLDAALLISEFAPGGAGPSDRPFGYRDLWSLVRSRPERVLGGAPYVWFTEGPEEVDRIFGLVDPTGQPVDESLAAIAGFYQSEAAAPTNRSSVTAEAVCDDEVTQLAWETLHGLQTEGGQHPFQASTPPSIMGPLDTLPTDPLRVEDIRFERAGDPARQGWLRESGVSAEWWVAWKPPSRPDQQLGLLILERGGGLEVGYVYNGQGQTSTSTSTSAWRCRPAAS